MSRRWYRNCLLGLWAAILLLVALIHGVGQRSLWIGPFVYAPQLLWPMAMVALAALSYKASRKLCLLMFATALFLAGPVMEWRTHGAIHAPIQPGDPDVLRVMTSNRGQHNGHSLASFIEQQQPDVLTTQDSSTPQAVVLGAPEMKRFPHVGRVGEFTLLSRYPIVSTTLIISKGTLSDHTTLMWFKAARFVVQFHARQIAIYSVHLPSPRHELKAYKSKSIVRSNTLQTVGRFWEEQQVLNEELLARMEADPLPVIVLGDWNLPPLGPRYRRLTQHLTDAHAQAGTGYGFSFPGDVWYAMTAGQPWLRLDYALCSKDWEPLECAVEPKSESQHSPVAAVLRLH